MTPLEIKEHIDIMRKYRVSSRIDDVSRYVFQYIFDTSCGKRFIKKNEFVKEFNKWVSQEFSDDTAYRFLLEIAIPNNAYVDAKLISIPWVKCETSEVLDYPIWLVQIHKAFPILSMGEYDSGKSVNAVCKLGIGLSYRTDDEKLSSNPINVGVILYSDVDSYGKSFSHVIKHEISHFVMDSVLAESMGNGFVYKDNPEDEFRYLEIDEFLADFIPHFISDYSMSYIDNIKMSIRNFQNKLYVNFNPTYSELYGRILSRLISYDIT